MPRHGKMTGFMLFAHQVWDYFPDGSDPHDLWPLYGPSQKEGYKSAAKLGGPTPPLQKPSWQAHNYYKFERLIEDPSQTEEELKHPFRPPRFPELVHDQKYQEFRNTIKSKYPLSTYLQQELAFQSKEELEKLRLHFRTFEERERDEYESHKLKQKWNVLESEKALGIGQDLDELDHFEDISNHWVD